MDWLSVSILIALAFVLLGIELFFIPGTTWVGITGLLLWVVAMVWSFYSFGEVIGGWILGSSGVFAFLLLFYGLKQGGWMRFALRNTHVDHVERRGESLRDRLCVGDKGRCRSALRPTGQVLFEDECIEACTEGEYLDAGTEVQIIGIDAQHIFVRKTPPAQATAAVDAT